jgi:hypothetical protein
MAYIFVVFFAFFALHCFQTYTSENNMNFINDQDKQRFQDMITDGKKLVSRTVKRYYYINHKDTMLEFISDEDAKAMMNSSIYPSSAYSDIQYLDLALSIYNTYEPKYGDPYRSHWLFDCEYQWSSLIYGRDYVGMAWSGNQAILSSGFWPKTMGGSSISNYLEEAAPNQGVVHAEYSSNNNYYGTFLAEVGQTTKFGYTGNACATYYHTVGNYDYSFSIGAGGLSFAISPTTSTAKKTIYGTFIY